MKILGENGLGKVLKLFLQICFFRRNYRINYFTFSFTNGRITS